jgi:glutaminyl-tRNA synthetase
VRLKSGYVIKGESVTKDADGNITEIQATYVPESRSGNDTSGLKVQGTLHWVSAEHAVKITVREYDRLFQVENVAASDLDFKELLNPNSLKVVEAYAEPALLKAKADERYQFMRKGYFVLDKDSTGNNLIFNRTVGLKDTWAKAATK